jgi:small subunit ribosomal protein S6
VYGGAREQPRACRWGLLGSPDSWNRYTSGRPATGSCSPRGAVQTRGGGALRQYEVLFILPPDVDESVVAGALDRVTRIISQTGGQVGKVDRWGRRRLAFELDKHSEGYYVMAEFTADPGVIKELERTLQLADEVIRSKVVVRGEAA